MTRKCLSPKITKIDLEVDNIVAIRLDKVLLGQNEDCICVGVYLPPENSNYYATVDNNNGVVMLEQCLLELYQM